ncbi:hypothetical protein F6X40_19895 [Paraburkholderia sp. UCT31]|uniref:hypothetical protein n=1 Tax=Paraburkholderia sp. UCT31 TaxID=2615209 RepID=UPI001655B382|nr:hypothetical protein [Paraburkholderia sp. UCT31]MBC8739019.1 hypothetical protein [Paraburkholderia sp. UCT31]
MADTDNSAPRDAAESERAEPREKPTTILVPHGCTNVRLHDAIEVVIAVAAARDAFPPTVDFYATGLSDDGEPVGESMMAMSNGGGLALYRAKACLAAICRKLGITPRDPYNPLADDYEATEAQNLTYRITVDEWAHLAAAYDVPFEIGPKPDIAQASGGEAPAKHASWEDVARAIADECYDRDTACGVRNSVNGYAQKVAEKMQQRGIRGPHGFFLSPATVRREALQSKDWWAKKQK